MQLASTVCGNVVLCRENSLALPKMVEKIPQKSSEWRSYHHIVSYSSLDDTIRPPHHIDTHATLLYYYGSSSSSSSAYNSGRWSMMRILREDFGIDHTQTHVPFLQNKNPKNKIGNKFFPFLSHPNQEGNANGQVFLPKTSPLQPQCLAIWVMAFPSWSGIWCVC